MRSATTLFSVLAQMNTGMGIALGALALSVTELLRGTPAGQPGVGDFHGAFLAMAALALLAEALALLLTRCPFPGILGCICAHPCEAACTRARRSTRTSTR